MMAAKLVIAAAIVTLSFEFAHAADYYTGDTFPQFWKDAATRAGLDWRDLAFNTTEAQWYYQHTATCVGFGAANQECESLERFCTSPLGHLHGESKYQMHEIKNMIDEGLSEHKLCPDCPAAPTGFMYVCHNGVKHEVALGAADAGEGHPIGSPGQKAIDPTSSFWFTCDCETIHRGFFDDGAYWRAEAASAGLDHTKITYYSGAWFYDGKYSCVAKGYAAQPCDSNDLVCAGREDTCGYGNQQMAALYDASLLPSGEHEDCPPH